MAQSLSQIYVHIVFSTKNRTPWIDANIKNELYAYMATVLKTHESPAIIIGGIADHVHILSRMSKNIAPAKLLEMVKKRSSKWIKTKGEKYVKFGWQNGYGVFSVSQSHVERVRKYIENQEEHHRRKNFQNEFRSLLEKYEISYDERYVWD